MKPIKLNKETMKEAEKKLIAAFETEKILLEKEEKKKYTKSLRFEFAQFCIASARYLMEQSSQRLPKTSYP